MKRKGEKPARLREMNQGRALAYCANLTRAEWFGMDDDRIVVASSDNHLIFWRSNASII